MQKRHSRKLITAIANSYNCPDCIADTALVDAGSGVFVLEVRHNDTCPELRRRTRRK